MNSYRAGKIKEWIMVAMVYVVPILLVFLFGCSLPGVMRDEDWTRLEETVKPRMTPEDWEAFKVELEARTVSPEQYQALMNDLLLKVKEIKDPLIDVGSMVAGLPDAVKEKSKDWTDDIVKWLIMTFGGGSGVAALVSSLRNSDPGKLLGPVFKRKES